jgi:hypothetical protein
MRPSGPVVLSVVMLAGLLLSVLIDGPQDELLILGLLGPAAVGAQIGWFTRTTVPTWLFGAAAAGGGLLVIAGFSRHSDAGPSRPLFWPLVVVGLAALPATAFIGGIAAGAGWRRARH